MKLAEGAVKESKFMPNLIEQYENHQAKTKKRKDIDGVNHHPFTYKFTEGYSSAVRYDVKMSYFFRSYDANN